MPRGSPLSVISPSKSNIFKVISHLQQPQLPYDTHSSFFSTSRHQGNWILWLLIPSPPSARAGWRTHTHTYTLLYHAHCLLYFPHTHPFLSFTHTHTLISFTHTLISLAHTHTHSSQLLLSPRRMTRKIPKAPFKVLDAPELQDDFYLNLLDWSSQNLLAVGLGSAVYLWNACTCQVCVCVID